MWDVENFVLNSGKSPIERFISKLSDAQISKISACLKLLSEFGPNIREPHSKKLTGYKNLFELRTSGSSPIRIFYTLRSNTFILLHAFIKKSNKTPTKEISIALKRMA